MKQFLSIILFFSLILLGCQDTGLDNTCNLTSSEIQSNQLTTFQGELSLEHHSYCNNNLGYIQTLYRLSRERGNGETAFRTPKLFSRSLVDTFLHTYNTLLKTSEIVSVSKRIIHITLLHQSAHLIYLFRKIII